MIFEKVALFFILTRVWTTLIKNSHYLNYKVHQLANLGNKAILEGSR